MQHNRQSTAPGINLIGRQRDDIGLGQAAWRTLDILRKQQIAVHEAAITDTYLPHRINLIIGDLVLPTLLTPKQRQFLTTDRYTVTQYYWELPRMLAAHTPALTVADEMWAASRYIEGIFTAATNTPIYLIPPVVTVTPSAAPARSAFGLPEGRMLFYFNFNVTSSYARKNPAGVVEAFRRAFGTAHADSPLLVIKAQFLEQYIGLYHHFARLVEDVGGVLINGSLTRQQTTDLMACTDAYVSLHRAEGFGFGMAEAMLLKKPVIATMYSGNTDFMTPENSYPVNASMHEITSDDHYFQPEYEAIYEPGQQWAEPDIDHAAALMRQVYENRDEARQRGEQAARDIARQYSPEVVGAMIAARLSAIDTSTQPEPLPTPTKSFLPKPVPAPQSSPSVFKVIARTLYHVTVPLSLRLRFRQMRNPDERFVPALYTQSVRFQAIEALAYRRGMTTIVALGPDDHHDIAALAQRFRVLAVDDAATLDTLRDIHGTLDLQPWHTPLSRLVLRRSPVIAHLDGRADDAAMAQLKTATDLGTLCIVSGTPDISTAAFATRLREHGLPVWTSGTADGLPTAIVGYPEEPPTPTPQNYRVVAVMPAFNEADIILPVLRHLIAQGVEVYVLDNHSTDVTGDIARSLLGQGVIAVETFPPKNSGTMEWGRLLQRVEQLSETLDADWIMFHDADEIRESYDPRLTLRDALYRVDRSGYNAVNHSLLNFVPTDNDFAPGSDPTAHFLYREPLAQRDYSVQVKAWKRGRVNLTDSGGHLAMFEGLMIYPFQFLTRHYPIRSQAHGERKIFQERKTRVKAEERKHGWHSHVDEFAPQQSFMRDPATLIRMDDTFYEQYMLERLTGVGLYPPDPKRPTRVFVRVAKRSLPTA